MNNYCVFNLSNNVPSPKVLLKTGEGNLLPGDYGNSRFFDGDTEITNNALLAKEGYLEFYKSLYVYSEVKNLVVYYK